jgi:hypothetical protein
MRDHTVRDGDRALTFFGTELAFESTFGASRRGQPRLFDDLRWTEMTIYRTIDGRYVLETIGRSDVYHQVTDPPGCKYGTVTLARDLDSDRRPCVVCKPSPARQLETNDKVSVELDRYSARIVNTAEELVAACHDTDESGYHYLTNSARKVLAAAADKDDAVSRAYFTERIA